MNIAESTDSFLINNAPANELLHALQLRPPKGGIPLTILGEKDDPDGSKQKARIEGCRTHFEPMIRHVTEQCLALGLTIQCTGSLTGTVYIRKADPEVVHALTQSVVEKGHHEECVRADDIMTAAIGQLPETSNGNIRKIRDHIEQCAYCTWVKIGILQIDAQEGDAVTKDPRIFDASHPSPLEILLRQKH